MIFLQRNMKVGICYKMRICYEITYFEISFISKYKFEVKQGGGNCLY